jgi:hypothetical protein
MKLGDLEDALRLVLGGSSAASIETETLDFKRDPHTLTGRGAPGNPQARLVEVLVDAVVCFANARGGRIVLGVDDRTPGPDAIIGTEADVTTLRNRIYGNTRPQLTVPIDEIQVAGKRLLVITVPEGLDLVTDSKGKALSRQGTSCVPLTEDARRALAHERRNPDLTARPSERRWADVAPASLSTCATRWLTWTTPAFFEPSISLTATTGCSSQARSSSARLTMTGWTCSRALQQVPNPPFDVFENRWSCFFPTPSNPYEPRSTRRSPTSRSWGARRSRFRTSPRSPSTKP